MNEISVEPGPAEREPVIHYDTGDTPAVTACGLPLDGRVHAAGERVSHVESLATCPPCRDVLDRQTSPLVSASAVFTPPAGTDVGLPDDELANELRESAGRLDPPPAVAARLGLIRCANCGEPEAILSARRWCGGCEEAAASATERRTVSLEVLTDELRTAACNMDAEDPRGVVGIVMRTNGQVVDIPELDSLWTSPYRRPADILSILLRQARMYADGLDGNAGAELLMPGPDVLAALEGKPVGRWTAAVETRWGLVRPGWYVSVERDGESVEEWALVRDRDDCHDPVCLVRGDSPSWACAVTSVQGRKVQHLDAFHSVMARIPADEAVEL